MTIPARDEPPAPHDPERRVIGALRAACPSFAPVWEEELAEWAPDDPPVYPAAGAFATHLVNLYDTGRTDELPAVFAAVDSLLADPDRGVQYVVTWGFLEDLSNAAGNRHGVAWAEGFRRWMSPACVAAWQEIDRTWGGTKSLADLIRRGSIDDQHA